MNIVLVCLDTFRADCVRALGRNPLIQTPNLDRFASESVVFENAFGEGQPTIPFRQTLCTGKRVFPWKGGFDTRGLWPNGDGWHRIPAEFPTLAELLLEAGYATALSADTYHMFKPTQNFTRGLVAYDFIRGQETDNWRFGGFDKIDPRPFLPPGDSQFNPNWLAVLFSHLLHVQDRRTEDDYFTAKVFRSASQQLEALKECQPFFLWVDSFDPHEPWDPPARFTNLYNPGWDEPWDPILGIHDKHPEPWRNRIRAKYHGEISFVDEWVGRLMLRLDELGMREDTAVVVMSDHGTEMMDHGKIGKGHHCCRYRCNSEILLMVRFPDDAHAGRRIPGLVQNHDIFPTLLSLCGIGHPPVDGLNLLPLMRGEVESLRDHIVTGWGPWANVRTLEAAYTCNFAGEAPGEWLFDARADYREDRNIAGDHPEECERARGRLEALLGGSLPVLRSGRPYSTESPIRQWFAESVNGRKLIERYFPDR